MEVSYDSLAKLNGEEELTTLKFRGHGGGGGGCILVIPEVRGGEIW